MPDAAPLSPTAPAPRFPRSATRRRTRTTPLSMLATLAALYAASLGALTVAPSTARAQEPVGSIRGTVIATGGLPVGGAVVTAGDTAGAIARSAVTDPAGRYLLAALQPGSYTVRVQRVGYRPAVRAGQRVAAGRELVLDIALERAPTLLDAQVVMATRTPSPLSDIPGAVTIVDRRALETQTTLATGLGDALGKLVPGLAAGAQSASMYGQSLRGRDVAVLIDGVPLSTTRNVSRDLTTIDPSMVERIEVLRGASAIYGDGATGGTINIITRRAVAGPPRLTTDVRATAALSAPGEGGGVRAAQTVAGASGRLDYTLGGSLERTGAFFDAEGDRIPPDPNGQGGLADTRAWDLLGKVGVRLADAQRLQVTANWYEAAQRTAFATLPPMDTVGEASARRGLRLDEPQGSRNGYVSLDYTHGRLLGGRVHAQLYGREYVTRFRPTARRVRRPSTGSTDPITIPTQSFVDSWKAGGRLEAETPVFGLAGATITWGADVVAERTFQALTVYDSTAYAASGGLEFRTVDEWMWVPPLDSRNLGLFAQLAWRVTPRLLLRGGVRHERDAVRVNDFSTIEEVRVAGGTLRYAPTVFNAGVVATAGRGVELFANFSQGFSLADLGRVLRGAQEGFTLGSHETDAQRVDQYEVGARGSWSRVQATLSGFRSRSDLGAQFDDNLRILRAPERIRGLEVTLDMQPASRWEVGGSFTWSEGEFLDPADSVWKALSSFRIAPPKVTAYVGQQTLPRWGNRLQLLWSGPRDRAFEDGIGYGGRPVAAFTTLDWASTLRVGGGLVRVGVENILNRHYFPTVSQLNGGNTISFRSAARGAVLTVGYQVEY